MTAPGEATAAAPAPVAVRPCTDGANPWEMCTAARRDGSGAWVEATEADYWYLLECLPPIYLPGPGGAFLCSEPVSRLADGRTVYTGGVVLAGRYFFRELPADGSAVAAVRELAAAVRAGAV